MPHFAIYCTDKPNSAQQRLDARAAHFTHVERVMGEILVAGPFKDREGEIIGSLLIIKADDAEAARSWLEQDPYYAADIWLDIAIHLFTPAAGEWIGGKIW